MSEPAAPQAGAHHGALLARGTWINTLGFLASNLRGIFTFLVARLLGSAALGTFGLAWAATDLVSKIATCGFDTSVIALVARREAVGDPAGSRRLMRTSLAMALGVSALLAVAGAALLTTFGSAAGLSRELASATAVLLLALPGIALYRVSNALSRGKGVMHHDIYSRGLTESLATVVALLLALAVGASALAPEVAVIAGTLASGLVAYALARRLFAGGAASAEPPSAEDQTPVARELVRHSAPIALYGLANIAIMQLDVIMLGLYVGRAPDVTLETLGIYAAACAIGGGLRKINQAFTPILTPVVARQIATGDVRGAEASYGYLARWMLAILLPLVAVLALAGGAILSIYGPSFGRGGVWVAVIGAACALNAFVGLGELVLMVKRPAVNLANSCAALAAAIGLNLLLIPAYGPLGAAIGMLVPYGLQGVLRGVEMSWLLGWRWPWRELGKPWAAALLALPLAIGVRLTGGTVVIQLAAAAVYLAGYAAAWRLVGLEANDREVLDLLLRRRTPVPAVVRAAS